MDDNHDLLSAHLASLYLESHHGKITAINQWDGGLAPRFHLCRSASGNQWRFREDLAPELEAALLALCRSESVVEDVGQSPHHHREFIRLLEAAAAIESVTTGPVFTLPTPATRAAPAHDVVPITADNAALLEPLMPDWLPDVRYRFPFMAAVVDGQAVAVCASVRITAAAHQAGVETHPDYRQQGHALTVVSAWSRAVDQQGAVPLYSTSWVNAASRAVARRLGGEFVGADYQVY